MLALLILATASLTSVRAELVEAPLVARAESGPSTGSGRTEEGKGSALDAERAFAADAQTLGQWTAFRKWASSDATMFVPQPINAQSWLKDRKDPAKAIDWWPTASYVSCDGSLAVNTGGWKRPDGAVGYFSTVWQRQPDGGWKWIVDGGDTLATPRAQFPMVRERIASCDKKPQNPRIELSSPRTSGQGHAPDGTLSWYWTVKPNGERRFLALIWTGTTFESVVADDIAAPPVAK